MKRLVFLFSLFLFSHIATAMCASSAIWLTSDTKIIHKNSILLLEFYGQSQLLIPELNKKYAIYLLSRNEKIILYPIEILTGGMRVTQVVLKPSGVLQEGNTYKLMIDNLPQGERIPGSYNPTTRQQEPASFVVSCEAGNDVQPAFMIPPVETGKSRVEYGCGPAKSLLYKFSTNNNSVSLIRTFVKNLSTGKTTEYILKAKDGVINVGHGMCSGPFPFIKENKYEISFAPVSMDGYTGKRTAAIALDQPLIASN